MTASRSRKWAVLFAVVVTQFAVPFMLSAVGVCLPAIGREYAASAVALSLVESVFLCVNAMLLLPIGRAADMCGRGGIFLIGLVIFALGTVGLTLAPGMEVFLVIRGIQAVGGAMTLATGLALLYDAFPREERGRALGISAAGIFLGISAGPFVGGVVATLYGWRWMFYAGMAPCAVALLVCLRNLDWRITAAPGERFDWAGTVTSALAVGLLVFGSAHVDKSLGLWGLGLGAVLFVVFLYLEKRAPAPLVQLRLFSSNRPFSLGVAAIGILGCAVFGVAFLLSLYLQFGRGMTAAKAGTVLMVQPVIQCLISPWCGRMADRYPAHVLSGFGSVLLTAGLAWAAMLTETTGLGPVIALLVVMGVGAGFFSSPSMVVVMSAVDEGCYGIASAVTGQSRTIGMTLCMAAVTIVITAFVGDRPLGPEVFRQYTLAMRWLFAGFTVLAALGAAISFLAGDRRAGRSGRTRDGAA
jgi:MFS family permease